MLHWTQPHGWVKADFSGALLLPLERLARMPGWVNIIRDVFITKWIKEKRSTARVALRGSA
jgi:hypothetical protein